MQYGVHFTGGKLQGMDATQCEELAHYLKEGDLYIITVKPAKPKAMRTLAQNSSMWLYFRKLAEALNDAGWDMRKVLKPEIEIPWNKDTVCEHLWKPIQLAVTGKASTRELDTKQPGDIHMVLDRHTGSKLGVTVPFPDRFTLMDGE